MNTTLDLQVLKRLKRARRNPFQVFEVQGMCNLVRDKGLPGGMEVLERAFRTWKHYSGNCWYPVPHPSRHPENAYDHTLHKWNPFTQYGRNRWKLLNHCIRYLEEQEKPVRRQ